MRPGGFGSDVFACRVGRYVCVQSATAQCVPRETLVKGIGRESKFANGTRLSKHARLVRGSLNVEPGCRAPWTRIATDVSDAKGPDQAVSMTLLLSLLPLVGSTRRT